MISGWRVTSTQPATPVLEGKRVPSRLSDPSPATASKTSSSASSSCRKIEAALAEKIARATSTIDWSRARCSLSADMTPAETAACRFWSFIGASDVRRGQIENTLQLERRELRVLCEDQGADRAHVRGREAVTRRTDPGAADPGDLDIDATAEKLDRRRRVVEERQRVGFLVAADRDHRREPPGIALDRHVVSRGDQDGAPEVSAVGELVQEPRKVLLRRREAHVDHVEALADRPAQALQ